MKKSFFLFILLICIIIKSNAQVRAGIYINAENTELEVRVKPAEDITGQIISANFTIRWNSADLIDLGTITNTASTSWVMVKSFDERTIGSYEFQSFTTDQNPEITWTAGQEYSIFKVPISGTPIGAFELAPLNFFEITAGGSPDYSAQDEYYIDINFISQVDEITPYYKSSTSSSQSTLPITLTNFTATLQRPERKVLVSWTTAMEINNKEFIVQRSVDALNFSDLKFIRGAGNSTYSISYTATDENPFSGISYYRLKQVDFDGSTSFSKVVSVKNNGPAAMPIHIQSAQPNPFQAKTIVNFSLDADAKVTLTLSDLLGNVIQTAEIEGHKGANTYIIAGTSLSDGIFFLHLNNGSEISSFKLIRGR